MRVVIGEDQALMRAGLSLVLERAGFEIVAIAADAEDVVRKTAAHRPDLLVTDIRMPPTNTDDGLRAALESRARIPGLPVLVLSQYLQRDYAVELLESGDEGVGYLLKQRIADVDRFIGDLRRLAAGGTVLDPAVVASMVDRHRTEEDPVARLTERQLAVLELMAQGRQQRGDRRAARRLREGDRPPHLEHLRRTGPGIEPARPPAGAGGCPLPLGLIVGGVFGRWRPGKGTQGLAPGRPVHGPGWLWPWTGRPGYER